MSAGYWISDMERYEMIDSMSNETPQGFDDSIRSLLSTIRKLEKAQVRMKEKNASTTLVDKRLTALQLGLALLDPAQSGKNTPIPRDELLNARQTIGGLLSSVEAMHGRSKSGSPQRTLLDRRIMALRQVILEVDRQYDLSHQSSMT